MNDDLIKRSDAIKAISKVDDYGDGIGFEVKSHCLVELELVPSADRPQEWIPCSERLPEERGIYLCTVGAPYRNPREMQYAPQEWADKSDNATWRNTNGSYVYDWLVEAWQPLPKPWKGAEYE